MTVANRVGTLLAGLMTTALVGCGNGDKDAAEDNLALWQAKGPASYIYLMETSCLCTTSGAVRVVVTDGVVTSAVDTVSNQARPGKTMTEVLREVVREAGAGNETFEATYDSTLGYLKRLEVDHDAGISDDEFSKQVTCLAPGVDSDVCPSP